MLGSIIVALTGIALLLGGIYLMKLGLQKLLWRKFRKILLDLTNSPLKGLLLGTVAAAIMQSSTVVSLLTIGLVSADYLSFYQGLGIILGANIGTCSTVQLMKFSLPPAVYLPVLILIVIAFIFTRGKPRYIAAAIGGLLSIFGGLDVISLAIGNLSNLDLLDKYVGLAKINPLYGILSGVIITFIFQSSSAATGILMLLGNGLLDLTTSAYIVYGNNIGSCLSSLLVGITAPLTARRVAIAHILLNVAGAIIFLPLTKILTGAAGLVSNNFSQQVVIIHTLFNVLSSIAILPVIKQYARLIILLSPAKR